MTSFTLFPAIHLKKGQVVRFSHGDPTRDPAVYSSDPVACAQNWIDQGATWLQVVNLDAAFDEEASHNWGLIKEICQLDVKIQFGGGIRTREDVDWAIESGIDRVIIGTAAVENPQLVAEIMTAYGADRIIAAIDSDESGEIRIRGWKNSGGAEAISFGRQMRHLGVQTAVYTSINRDGSMSGVDLDTAMRLSNMTGLNIIVGGGVRHLSDVLACYNKPGISGVVVGRALYTGNLDLKKAYASLGVKLGFETGLPLWKEEQAQPSSKLKYALTLANLQKYIPVDGPSLHILDAGGGNGKDAIALAQLGHTVELVDTSKSMLADAEATAAEVGVSDRIKTINADIQHIREIYPEPTFQIVLSHNVIQYIDEPIPYLHDLFGQLVPGGVLSLIGLNQDAQPLRRALLDRDLVAAMDQLDRGQTEDTIFRNNARLYSGNEVEELIDRAGGMVLKRYGIRCIADYLPNANPEELQTIELALGAREPYRSIARYFHLFSKKQP